MVDQSKMRNPEISVLMAVHNGERFLAESIVSVLREREMPIELVIVDDRSADGSPKILAEIAQQDSRLIVIRLDSNVGLTAALNVGLRHCHGQFIARLDADDVNLPTRFVRQRAAVEQGNSVGFVGSNALRINVDGHPIGDYFSKALDHEAILDKLRALRPFCPHSSFFVPRQIFERLDGYRPQYFYAQDFDFMLRLSEYNDLRFSFITEPLVALRVHTSSISYSERSGRLQLISAVSALTEHLLRLDGLRPPDPSRVHYEVENALINTKCLAIAELRRRLIVAYLTFSQARGKAIRDITSIVLRHPSLVFKLRGLKKMKVRAAHIAARNLISSGTGELVRP